MRASRQRDKICGMISPVQVGLRAVGPGGSCLIAAEIGLNHNGDKELACRTIEAAAAAGADAVKFQNYRTEDFLSDRTLTYEYVSQGQTVVEPQFDMFKRYELPASWLSELRQQCDEAGLIFFSTPTGEDGINELVEAGARLLKNGSDYLVHLPLIQAMARSGLPTVLSTGMANLAEIDDAVCAFREAGGSELVLLHCTSSYPTPPQDVHLRKIQTLASAFACPVGLSDHTEGCVAAVGATTLGACMIEKHFTLDKTLPGPDHRFSADPSEFKNLVKAVRDAEHCLGNSAIKPTLAETDARIGFRLSCVAKRDLSAGETLTPVDIAFRRPANGYPPSSQIWLVGRRLSKGIQCGFAFAPEHFGGDL